MKSLILSLCLIVAVIVEVQASEMAYLQCAVDGKKDALLLTKATRTWGGYLYREATGYVAADSCYSFKDAPEELKQSIANRSDIVTICVYISSDDGSGDAVIVRKGNKPQVEMLFVDLNDLTPKKGQVLNCF